MIKTFKYRIKDRASKKLLAEVSSYVNYIWNYCRDVSKKHYIRNRRTLSGFDLNNLTSGTCKVLNIHSEVVQSVCEQYARSSRQHKKLSKFRSYKRSLNWVSFKTRAVKLEDDAVVFMKHNFKFWKSREIEGKIKTGSFVQNSRGRWFVNLVCEVEVDFVDLLNKTGVGIDLGLKTKLTLSDGTKYDRENLTKKNEQKLAAAQRAGKKRQVKKIHDKIKNQRLDWNHKVSTEIVNKYSEIVIGDIKSTDIIKFNKRMSKSVYDASWYQLKQLLKYKALMLGVDFFEINEAYTTQTCSICGEKNGPKGQQGLGIRKWVCANCETSHDRDVNAAQNIFRLGHQSPKGNPRF